MDEFAALANRGNVNKNGTMEDIAWAAMGREQVQDQLNDADKSYISAIDIISYYWKYSSGNLMMKVSWLHELGDETVEAEDVKIYYPDTLALYLMGSCIGVKSSCKPRFYVEDK